MDGRGGEPGTVEPEQLAPEQLALQALRTKVTCPPEGTDAVEQLGGALRRGELVRAPAARVQAGVSFGLVATEPLAEGGSADAAAAAGEAGVVGLLVGLDPAEAGLENVRIVSHRRGRLVIPPRYLLKRCPRCRHSTTRSSSQVAWREC